MPAVRLPVRHRVRPLTSAVQAALPQSPHILANDPRVENRLIETLKFHSRRSKKHPRKKIEQLKGSLDCFGFNGVIGIKQDGTIVTGHACVIAAKELGHTHIRTLCIDHLTECELRAFMVAHNKLSEGSEVDLEMLKVELLETAEVVDYDFSILGFDDAEVDIILHGDDETAAAEDVADEGLPALRKDPVTRVGDLWGLNLSRFLCGDALDPASYARLMGEERAHLIITDPPYNCKVQGHVSGLGRNKHREFAMASGEMTSSQFTAFLTGAFTPLAAYSVEGSLHYVFMDHRQMLEILTAGAAVYDSRLNLLVWKKTNGSMGSFYRSQHELIFLFKKGTAPHINNVQLGANGRYRTNILEYAGANTFRAGRDEELANHPTPKPVPLVADLIRDASNINDWVLDCFAGGGTIFIAAEKTHRRAAGIELDALYADLAIERWQKFTGKKAILPDRSNLRRSGR